VLRVVALSKGEQSGGLIQIQGAKEGEAEAENRSRTGKEGEVIQRCHEARDTRMETSDLVWWNLFVVAKGEGDERKSEECQGESRALET
jgi:hypothetical protein